jgi:hypothetical protein
MRDQPSSPRSDEPAPRSSAPTVASASGLAGATETASRLPVVISAIGPPTEVASECLHAALAQTSSDGDELSLEVEIVTAGKLEVGGKRATEIASGLLSDPSRRRAIEHCRAVYCVTSSSGQCELALRDLAHDAKLSIAAELTNGVVVRKTATLLALLQDGLTLEVQERTFAINPSVPDCRATRRSLEERAQLTPIPAEAAGHQLDARVDVMSSGLVADIRPASGADPKALSALRSQLASLRGLAGPCSDLPISLRY